MVGQMGNRERCSELLLIFVRLPEQGRAKTRLAAGIGNDHALALYRRFVTDTLSLSRHAGYRSVVFFEPAEAGGRMTEWLGTGFAFEPQEGKDLGERMYAAFRTAFHGCERAVLLGSDCPDLEPAVLHEAFGSLKEHDGVIGPALDGGYYLIGFSSDTLPAAAFRGIPWGGSRVFEETTSLFREMGLDIHRVAERRDIDDEHDLRQFFALHRELPRGRLATIDYLRDCLHW
jgi:hypothetical protein